VSSELGGSFALVPGSAGAGQIYGLVVLTNTSQTPCTTFGYVGMLLRGSGGVALPTDVVRGPGTEPLITLTPGASASAVAHFSPDVPGPGDSQTGSCQPVATTTEITPPNDTNHIIVAGPNSSVCEQGTMQLQPLRAGTNAQADINP
jgi:hypothetical protein